MNWMMNLKDQKKKKVESRDESWGNGTLNWVWGKWTMKERIGDMQDKNEKEQRTMWTAEKLAMKPDGGFWMRDVYYGWII